MQGAIASVLRLLPLNPICLRLVQGGSRRTRHLYIRTGFLALMIVILLFALLGSGTSLRDLAQRGSNAFQVVSYGQVALICLLTPVFMGGAIAQESNPRTWDILLTTPLSSLQIVLGNLFGRLFFVLALLMSTFPLFAVMQLFGGVPGSTIIGSYLVAAASALLVGAIAVTLSVTRVAGRRAVFVFYSCVVLYLAVTYAIDLGLRTPSGVGPDATWTTVCTPLNPFLGIEALLTPATYSPREFAGTQAPWFMRAWLGHPVGTQVWLFVALSTGLCLWATLRVRLLGAGSPAAGGRMSAENARDPRTVGQNPIAWRELHLRGQTVKARAFRWGFLAAGIGIALGTLVLHRGGTLSDGALRLALASVLGAEVIIVTLAALNTSATAVSKEREDGSLDILLTTPIQPGPYLSGKLRGIVLSLSPLIAVPCLTQALASLYIITNGFGGGKALSVSESVGTRTVSVPLILPEVAIALPLVLLAFIAMTVMTGLAWSVRSKGTIGSVFAATGAVLTAAGAVGLCGIAAGSGIPYVGAAINALTPFNLAIASVEPGVLIPESLDDPVSRVTSLLVGALAAAAIYVGITYGMHANLKASFMMTVRRLAGIH